MLNSDSDLGFRKKKTLYIQTGLDFIFQFAFPPLKKVELVCDSWLKIMCYKE